jgi:hypothetical protein
MKASSSKAIAWRGSSGNHGCHLAFFEMDCKKLNHLVIWPFWMSKKIVYCETFFGEIWAKIAIFYKILTLYLVILNLALIFEDLAFLKLLVVKFGLFNFLESGNPGGNRTFIEIPKRVHFSSHSWWWLWFNSIFRVVNTVSNYLDATQWIINCVCSHKVNHLKIKMFVSHEQQFFIHRS